MWLRLTAAPGLHFSAADLKTGCLNPRPGTLVVKAINIRSVIFMVIWQFTDRTDRFVFFSIASW